jgi:hypothetical protein
MASDGNWYEGDRVYVPRITKDESISITIFKFEGDEEDPDPDVLLLLKEIRQRDGSSIHADLIRQTFRYAKLSELQDPPVGRATRGGAFARQVRNLAPIACGCGCGQETSGTEFKQGHDAKLKSKLRKIVDGKLDGDVDEAKAELDRRGWT